MLVARDNLDRAPDEVALDYLGPGNVSPLVIMKSSIREVLIP